MSDLLSASRRLMNVLPTYFGLAVPLDGEEDQFHAAESELAQAAWALLRVLDQEERQP